VYGALSYVLAYRALLRAILDSIKVWGLKLRVYGALSYVLAYRATCKTWPRLTSTSGISFTSLSLSAGNALLGAIKTLVGPYRGAIEALLRLY
jgi:hypothetical protein